MTYTSDITIIGAGPAACAAALTIKQHAPELSIILLHDNRRKHRAVESLSPHAGSLLRRIGVWPQFLAKNFLPTYGTSAIWGSEVLHSNEFIYQTEGQGWHVDREVFDRLLQDIAEAIGITCLSNTQYIRHKDSNEQIQLITKEKDILNSITTRFVIDASGRNGAFAKRMGAEKQFIDHLIAVFGIFESKNSNKKPDKSTLVEAVENGWWYTAGTNQNQQAVAFMTDADLSKKLNILEQNSFLAYLEKTQEVKKRSLDLQFLGALEAFSAASFFLSKMGGKQWIAVGDAAYTLDPLSSNGILKALRSGILGAYATLDFFKGKWESGLEKYEKLTFAEHDAYLKTREEFYKEEKRWSTASFWQRRGHALKP